MVYLILEEDNLLCVSRASSKESWRILLVFNGDKMAFDIKETL